MNTCVHGQRIGGCSICRRKSPHVLLAVDDSPAPTYADVLTRERDAYKAQVASLRADLARVTKDRDRLLKLFDDAGQGEHNVLALVDYYQDQALTAGRERDALKARIECEEDTALAQPLAEEGGE